MNYEAVLVDYAGVFTEPEIAAIVERLRGMGFRTGLVSNADRRPPLPDVFDTVVISGEVGVAKPDREIFQRAVDNLAVDPANCVYIDDVARYVHGAAAVGLTGIHHRTVESTVDELEVLLERSLK